MRGQQRVEVEREDALVVLVQVSALAMPHSPQPGTARHRATNQRLSRGEPAHCRGEPGGGFEVPDGVADNERSGSTRQSQRRLGEVCVFKGEHLGVRGELWVGAVLQRSSQQNLGGGRRWHPLGKPKRRVMVRQVVFGRGAAAGLVGREALRCGRLTRPPGCTRTSAARDHGTCRAASSRRPRRCTRRTKAGSCRTRRERSRTSASASRRRRRRAARCPGTGRAGYRSHRRGIFDSRSPRRTFPPTTSTPTPLAMRGGRSCSAGGRRSRRIVHTSAACEGRRCFPRDRSCSSRTRWIRRSSSSPDLCRSSRTGRSAAASRHDRSSCTAPGRARTARWRCTPPPLFHRRPWRRHVHQLPRFHPVPLSHPRRCHRYHRSGTLRSSRPGCRARYSCRRCSRRGASRRQGTPAHILRRRASRRSTRRRRRRPPSRSDHQFHHRRTRRRRRPGQVAPSIHRLRTEGAAAIRFYAPR